MSKRNLFLPLFIFIVASIAAQQTGNDTQALSQRQQVVQNGSEYGLTAAERLSLAVSSFDYPVTYGDVYRLTYRQSAGTVISFEILVDSMRMLDLGVFGKVDGSGQNFVQIKQKVEALISKNYTFSMPNLAIVSPGVFRVNVRDGASMIRYTTAWGLSRLSEIVAVFSSPSISRRNVELVSQDGKSRTYDLLKAALKNDSSLDPLIKPGDSILLHSPGNTIRLSGEVSRPGSYELRGDEGLEYLVETLGGGLSNQADANRIRIDRSTKKGEMSDYISIPAAYQENITLSDGDSVLVRARTDRLPLVWFEGAVSSQVFENVVTQESGGGTQGEQNTLRGSRRVSVDDTAAGTAASAGGGTIGLQYPPEGTNGRFSYAIREGQLLSDILQDIRTGFLPMADLASAALFMPDVDAGVNVDIQSLLSGTDMSTDVALFAGYRIVIPPIQTTVMVSGAVYLPGAVPYKPNAPAEYYIILAGGADTWRNSYGSCQVFDQNGNKRRSSQPIQPGDHIHVRENNPWYALERRTPLVAAVVTLALSLLTYYAVAP